MFFHKAIATRGRCVVLTLCNYGSSHVWLLPEDSTAPHLCLRHIYFWTFWAGENFPLSKLTVKAKVQMFCISHTAPLLSFTKWHTSHLSPCGTSCDCQPRTTSWLPPWKRHPRVSGRPLRIVRGRLWPVAVSDRWETQISICIINTFPSFVLCCTLLASEKFKCRALLHDIIALRFPAVNKIWPSIEVQMGQMQQCLDLPYLCLRTNLTFL